MTYRSTDDYSSACPVHAGSVHGKEAEELRAGIEEIIANKSVHDPNSRLQQLLDRVDARDSLAWLEANDQEHRQLRALRSESVVDEYPFAAQFLDRVLATHAGKP